MSHEGTTARQGSKTTFYKLIIKNIYIVNSLQISIELHFFFHVMGVLPYGNFTTKEITDLLETILVGLSSAAAKGEN